jgi:peptidyl-prolyl cis-trans isomerase C
MRRVLVASLLLALVFIVPIGCKVKGGEKDEVLARIGGQIVTQKDLDDFIKTLPADQQDKYNTDEGRKVLLEALINQKILEMAAKEIGMNNDPLVKQRMEYAAMRVLIMEYYNKYINENLWIPDNQLKDYYSKHKEDFVAPEKVKIKCIVKKDKDAAQSIYDRLMKGEKFDVLANNESEDASTRSLGGLLPEFDASGNGATGLAKDTNVQKKAFQMAVGELSEPFQTDYGYVIMMVQEKTPAQQKPFDDVRAEIAKAIMVTDEAVENFYNQNIDKYKQSEMYEVASCYFTDRAKADAALAALRAGSKSFMQVAQESDIEDSAKSKGGYSNWLKKGGMISALGKSEEAEKLIWGSNVNDFVGPVKGDKGWHIFMIKNYQPEGYKKLEEVHDSIADALYSQYKSEAADRAFADLMDKYNVVNYIQLGDFKNMTAKEIMEAAKNATNPVQAITAYKALVALYPKDEHANEAQFLIGFLNAEELQRYDEAEKAFEKLFKDYPNSDFIDDAQWMMENMRQKTPISSDLQKAVNDAAGLNQ